MQRRKKLHTWKAMTRIYNENMPKSMYDMDEQELGALIEKLSETVERLAHQRPGSGEYNHESGVLKDARLLLADRRKKKEVRTDVKF